MQPGKFLSAQVSSFGQESSAFFKTVQSKQQSRCSKSLPYRDIECMFVSPFIAAGSYCAGRAGFVRLRLNQSNACGFFRLSADH
jgi:hypothetical protein